MSTPRTKPNDQWTEYEAAWVEEVEGEPFRYRVESHSEPLFFHTVDLTQRGGHGACTCKHFQVVANPNFRRHGKHIPYAPKREGVSECRHIRAALDHFHLHVTIPMLASFKNGISPNNQH
jgi:hypothetical protein